MKQLQVEDAHSFAGVLAGSKLIVVADADHNYTNPAHAQQLVKEVTQFFLETLPPSTNMSLLLNTD
jgi:hypothetical protein